VPVAFEVAKALNARLGIAFVRKIGAPGHHELGIGAVVDGAAPEVFLNEEVMGLLQPTKAYIDAEIQRQLAEIERRRDRYNAPPQNVTDRTVIVVDDGIATGGTITAVLRAIRKRNPKRLVAAVPVAPASAIDALGGEADEVVCLSAPEYFGAVGVYYRDFSQTSDDEVISLIRQSAAFGSAKNVDTNSDVPAPSETGSPS
jgi:predicted phosphoribosyltransferase